MVLFIGDHMVSEVPTAVSAIYSTWPVLKETSPSLTNMMVEEVNSRGLLYLRPREYAVTVPDDPNVQLLGTDDATTSLMAVLRYTSTGAVGLAHFDKCSHEECLRRVHVCSHDDGVLHLLTRIKELSHGFSEGRLELGVVGGFGDSRGICESIALSLLNAFHRCLEKIHLMLLCTGEMNTTIRGNISFPMIKGIGVNTQSGKIFPATFSDKGPYLVLRSTRVFTGAQHMVNVYDYSSGVLYIAPFNYEPHAGVDLLLQQPDNIILQCLSTSPEVEDPNWVKMVRDVLQYIKEHPFPAVTIFPDNRPHFFGRDSHGGWVKVELPNNNDSTPDANIQAVLQQSGTWSSPAGTVTTTSTVPPPPTPVAPQPTPWGSTMTSRYGSLHLDCRLKTAPLGVPPMVTAQHYDDPLLNPAKDRFIPPTWQASQL